MFENLGPALALLRELQGLSQKDLASRAGIGKSQISKYEGGKEYPKLETLEKILEALHVSAHQFWYVFYLVDTSKGVLKGEEEGWSSEPPPLPGSEAAIGRLLSEVSTLRRTLFEEEMRRRLKEK